MTARVLILDSSARSLLDSLARTLEPGICVDSFSDPQQALAHLQQTPPDLMLCNHHLPDLDGVAFIRHARALSDAPMLIATLAEDRHSRQQALESGASDVLARPLDPLEFRARCRNLLALRRSQQAQAERGQWLEAQVMQATRDVRARERETLGRLAKAGEYRDQDTGNHLVRMAKYSRLIAEQLALSVMECDEIEIAAPMHDIGKIGIPDLILLKRGRHTPDEQTIMRTHPVIGYRILADSPSRYLQLGAIIALSHHERFDGGGYPQGLAGADIPLIARIVTVADVFDALTSKRPYKEAWPYQEALDYVRAETGKHFDPACVQAFERSLDAVQAIMRTFGDAPPAA
jgi:two-component system response regulator RpfG